MISKKQKRNMSLFILGYFVVIVVAVVIDLGIQV